MRGLRLPRDPIQVTIVAGRVHAGVPDVVGMWNMCVYGPDMLFVANEIHRFSIGSTTDGVTGDADRTLTIHVQHDRPAGADAANDDNLVGELMGILSRGGAQVRDSSIDSANANTADSEASIKQVLARRIKRAGTVFVIVSPDTKNHGWADWEVEYIVAAAAAADSVVDVIHR